jgi:hypothetical protein
VVEGERSGRERSVPKPKARIGLTRTLSIHGAPGARENVIHGSLLRREELGSRAIRL